MIASRDPDTSVQSRPRVCVLFRVHEFVKADSIPFLYHLKRLLFSVDVFLCLHGSKLHGDENQGVISGDSVEVIHRGFNTNIRY